MLFARVNNLEAEEKRNFPNQAERLIKIKLLLAKPRVHTYFLILLVQAGGQ